MASDGETRDEKFLSRWSRLKREEARQSPARKEEARKGEATKEEPRAPVLPALDKLTPESDFAAFMHPKVEDALRRVALKKLFSDPHFNVADPFEAYSGDWTGGEAISDEMLATLNQARTLLFDKDDKKEEETQKNQAADEKPAGEKPEHDEPRSKDA